MPSTILPSTEHGFLPYYLLLVSLTALTHTLVTYINPTASLKQFSGPLAPPKTRLLAHVYGIKNVYSCLIRLYAAYQITNGALYDLALVTFLGVLVLFGSELLVWRTVRIQEGVFPFITAGVGVVWMVSGRGDYLA
ncbi:Erg28 family protein [Aspergillus affinis]|uniref:Erg28 family protein n=1 Tax=Aspergillus affinis TaxID=1070780 RepID=UPI0022FE0FA9|nr:ergosterol biosynthesis protein-like protein Erg28 [Aspergillus affinis]KAI9043951.1 ergosterol biosynthesis protein-like protein Erg28 [Aspergillus affinis]